MELLVDAGLTPLQAIQAATVNNFELLQESDRLGTVEPGKAADLVVLGADPLADIRNTRSLELVIQDGRIMDRGYHADFVDPAPRTGPVAGGLRFSIRCPPSGRSTRRQWARPAGM